MIIKINLSLLQAPAILSIIFISNNMKHWQKRLFSTCLGTHLKITLIIKYEQKKLISYVSFDQQSLND